LSTNEPSRFSREFKLEACAGWRPGRTSAFWPGSWEFHARAFIYQWRNRYRLGGGTALRSQRGRTTKAEISAGEEKPAAEKLPEKEARQTSLEELARPLWGAK
jgi:transposase-like protein